jgi:hypothetical protein
MNGRDSTPSLLVLRKLTRAITDAVRVQMTEHLATLTPLFRPSVVLGDYIKGAHKEPTRKTEKAFKELQALYETVGAARPFNLPRELSAPLIFPNDTLEITPYDYAHEAKSGADSRTIKVRRPLTWTLTYTGYPPSRLQELLDTTMRSTEELHKIVLSYLIMHVVTKNQPGVTRILEALHFPLTTIKVPEFGDLPVTRISVALSTERPSDAIVLESAGLTGMDAFEEVVKVEELSRLPDPLKERLLEIVRQQAPELVSR